LARAAFFFFTASAFSACWTLSWSCNRMFDCRNSAELRKAHLGSPHSARNLRIIQLLFCYESVFAAINRIALFLSYHIFWFIHWYSLISRLESSLCMDISAEDNIWRIYRLHPWLSQILKDFAWADRFHALADRSS
jgi:hypothetical protein